MRFDDVLVVVQIDSMPKLPARPLSETLDAGAMFQCSDCITASAFCSVGLLAVLYSPVETDAPPTYLERTIAELSAGPWVLDTEFSSASVGLPLWSLIGGVGWVYVVDALTL